MTSTLFPAVIALNVASGSIDRTVRLPLSPAHSGEVMTGASESGPQVGDRRSSISDRKRSPGGSDRAHPVFHPSNGEASQDSDKERDPAEGANRNPRRFDDEEQPVGVGNQTDAIADVGYCGELAGRVGSGGFDSTAVERDAQATHSRRERPVGRFGCGGGVTQRGQPQRVVQVAASLSRTGGLGRVCSRGCGQARGCEREEGAGAVWGSRQRLRSSDRTN